MGKSPWHWIQAPGIGLEVMGGAASNIWPEMMWISWVVFGFGALLIVIPIGVWLYKKLATTREYAGHTQEIKKEPSITAENPTSEDDFGWYAAKKEGSLPTRIPLIDILREAEALGWKWNAKNNGIIKFIKLLRDEGSTGDIQFWGREKGRYDFTSSSKPLGGIASEYWLDYYIDWMTCLEISDRTGSITGEYLQNAQTKTQHDTNALRGELYLDIHLDKKQSLEWLDQNKLG